MPVKKRKRKPLTLNRLNANVKKPQQLSKAKKKKLRIEQRIQLINKSQNRITEFKNRVTALETALKQNKDKQYKQDDVDILTKAISEANKQIINISEDNKKLDANQYFDSITINKKIIEASFIFEAAVFLNRLEAAKPLYQDKADEENIKQLKQLEQEVKTIKDNIAGTAIATQMANKIPEITKHTQTLDQLIAKSPRSAANLEPAIVKNEQAPAKVEDIKKPEEEISTASTPTLEQEKAEPKKEEKNKAASISTTTSQTNNVTKPNETKLEESKTSEAEESTNQAKKPEDQGFMEEIEAMINLPPEEKITKNLPTDFDSLFDEVAGPQAVKSEGHLVAETKKMTEDEEEPNDDLAALMDELDSNIKSGVEPIKAKIKKNNEDLEKLAENSAYQKLKDQNDKISSLLNDFVNKKADVTLMTVQVELRKFDEFYKAAISKDLDVLDIDEFLKEDLSTNAPKPPEVPLEKKENVTEEALKNPSDELTPHLEENKALDVEANLYVQMDTETRKKLIGRDPNTVQPQPLTQIRIEINISEPLKEALENLNSAHRQEHYALAQTLEAEKSLWNVLNNRASTPDDRLNAERKLLNAQRALDVAEQNKFNAHYSFEELWVKDRIEQNTTTYQDAAKTNSNNKESQLADIKDDDVNKLEKQHIVNLQAALDGREKYLSYLQNDAANYPKLANLDKERVDNAQKRLKSSTQRLDVIRNQLEKIKSQATPESKLLSELAEKLTKQCEELTNEINEANKAKVEYENKSQEIQGDMTKAESAIQKLKVNLGQAEAELNQPKVEKQKLTKEQVTQLREALKEWNEGLTDEAITEAENKVDSILDALEGEDLNAENEKDMLFADPTKQAVNLLHYALIEEHPTANKINDAIKHLRDTADIDEGDLPEIKMKPKLTPGQVTQLREALKRLNDGLTKEAVSKAADKVKLVLNQLSGPDISGEDDDLPSYAYADPTKQAVNKLRTALLEEFPTADHINDAIQEIREAAGIKSDDALPEISPLPPKEEEEEEEEEKVEEDGVIDEIDLMEEKEDDVINRKSSLDRAILARSNLHEDDEDYDEKYEEASTKIDKLRAKYLAAKAELTELDNKNEEKEAKQNKTERAKKLGKLERELKAQEDILAKQSALGKMKEELTQLTEERKRNETRITQLEAEKHTNVVQEESRVAEIKKLRLRNDTLNNTSDKIPGIKQKEAAIKTLTEQLEEQEPLEPQEIKALKKEIEQHKAEDNKENEEQKEQALKDKEKETELNEEIDGRMQADDYDVADRIQKLELARDEDTKNETVYVKRIQKLQEYLDVTPPTLPTYQASSTELNKAKQALSATRDHIGVTDNLIEQLDNLDPDDLDEEDNEEYKRVKKAELEQARAHEAYAKAKKEFGKAQEITEKAQDIEEKLNEKFDAKPRKGQLSLFEQYEGLAKTFRTLIENELKKSSRDQNELDRLYRKLVNLNTHLEIYKIHEEKKGNDERVEKIERLMQDIKASQDLTARDNEKIAFFTDKCEVKPLAGYQNEIKAILKMSVKGTSYMGGDNSTATYKNDQVRVHTTKLGNKFNAASAERVENGVYKHELFYPKEKIKRLDKAELLSWIAKLVETTIYSNGEPVSINGDCPKELVKMFIAYCKVMNRDHENYSDIQNISASSLDKEIAFVKEKLSDKTYREEKFKASEAVFEPKESLEKREKEVDLDEKPIVPPEKEEKEARHNRLVQW